MFAVRVAAAEKHDRIVQQQVPVEIFDFVQPLQELCELLDGIDSWQFELTEGGRGTIAVDGDAIVFRTTKVGLENWHVQAYQIGVDLADGNTYELKFTAKSPDGSTVLVMGIINEEDWHGIGLQEEVYLGENFRDYTFTFTASDVVPKNNRIGFVLGENAGTVEVKNMSLLEK